MGERHAGSGRRPEWKEYGGMKKSSLASSIICGRRWATPTLSGRTGAHRQTPSAKGLAICMVPVDPVSVLCCRVLVSWDEP